MSLPEMQEEYEHKKQVGRRGRRKGGEDEGGICFFFIYISSLSCFFFL